MLLAKFHYFLIKKTDEVSKALQEIQAKTDSA